MFDAPMPELDLGAIAAPCHPPTWTIAQLLADGLDPADQAAVERTGSYSFADDDDDRPSTLTYQVRGAKRTLPLRKARDAWALACARGLVPPSWQADPRRVFADQEVLFFCKECEGMGAVGYNYDDICSECNGKGNAMRRSTTPVPGSLAAMWMLADPGLVEAAEAAAREAVRRLPGAPAIDRVQWGRIRESKPAGTVGLVITSPIWDRLRVASWDWDRMKGPAFHGAPWRQAAGRLDALTREMLCRDVGGAWAHLAAGVVDSPFTPLLRLWELGFVFEELHDDAIVLDRACARTRIRTWSSHVPLA
jgi:hypothetical protein